jgi:signal peptidase I
VRKVDTIDKKEISKKSRDGYKKLIFFLAAFLTVILFRTVVMERTIISGNSMYPTLMDSDVCLTAKYRNEPERYDIVVAKVQCHTIIKRVIGLPGETLEVKGGKVYIDGKEVTTEYDFYTENGGILSEPYTLTTDEYFLMGDNRQESYDSREFGSIKKEDIKGIVLCRIFPFMDIKIYSR